MRAWPHPRIIRLPSVMSPQMACRRESVREDFRHCLRESANQAARRTVDTRPTKAWGLLCPMRPGTDHSGTGCEPGPRASGYPVSFHRFFAGETAELWDCGPVGPPPASESFGLSARPCLRADAAVSAVAPAARRSAPAPAGPLACSIVSWRRRPCPEHAEVCPHGACSSI